MSTKQKPKPRTQWRLYRVELIHRLLDRDATLMLKAHDSRRARQAAVLMMAVPSDWIPLRAAIAKATGSAA